jgi:hypothetical protein
MRRFRVSHGRVRVAALVEGGAHGALPSVPDCAARSLGRGASAPPWADPPALGLRCGHARGALRDWVDWRSGGAQGSTPPQPILPPGGWPISPERGWPILPARGWPILPARGWPILPPRGFSRAADPFTHEWALGHVRAAERRSKAPRRGGGQIPLGHRFRGLNLKQNKKGIRQFDFTAFRELHLGGVPLGPIDAKSRAAAERAVRKRFADANEKLPEPLRLMLVKTTGAERTWKALGPDPAGWEGRARSVAAATRKAAEQKQLDPQQIALAAEPVRGRFQFLGWYDTWQPIMINDRQLSINAENANSAARKTVTALHQAGFRQLDAQGQELPRYDFQLTRVLEIDPERGRFAAEMPRRTHYYHYEGQFVPFDKPRRIRRQGREDVHVQGRSVAQLVPGHSFSIPFTEIPRVREVVALIRDGRINIRHIQRQIMNVGKPLDARMDFIERLIAAAQVPAPAPEEE